MNITLEQQEKGAELMKTLTQKAWESASFKEQLVKNPVAAIEEVTGKKLANFDDKRVVVEDQTDESVIYLNIPAKIDINELELTEEQLETIAGGVTPAAYVAGVALGIGVCALVDYMRG
ncbi:class IIb bacteriocin, lactobin A/cerein 7B family [Parapedobacter tibetensis]|uniref:class IIb bacteriocin, lactobin A/cerein 7B family n=1 Tax=Parapedobacter tibetensis TaxID=2972951 RepID=UPI00214D7698|nr:class IIb bacteriocin, lactobin A/cerein 7B family [Parapedobacter tibetensis]